MAEVALRAGKLFGVLRAVSHRNVLTAGPHPEVSVARGLFLTGSLPVCRKSRATDGRASGGNPPLRGSRRTSPGFGWSAPRYPWRRGSRPSPPSTAGSPAGHGGPAHPRVRGGGGRGTGGGTAVPEGVWGGGWTVKPGPGPIQVNGGDALVGRQVGTGRLGRLGGPFHMGSGMGLGEEYQKVLGVAIVGVGYHLRAPSRKARQYFDTLIRGFSPA